MTHDKRVWMYRQGESRIFDSPDAVPKNEGWRDSPAPAAPEVAATPAEPLLPVDDDAGEDERATLIANAEALGVKVDGRWSDKRLLKEIERANGNRP